MTPRLWADETLRRYTEGPVVMITDEKLSDFLESTAGVPQLNDMHAAFRELAYRRAEEMARNRVAELTREMSWPQKPPSLWQRIINFFYHD